MKNENAKSFLVAIVLLVIAIGAYWFPSVTVIERVESVLGGGTRFPNGISTDSTSPSSGEIRGSTLTITGAQTLTGATTLSSSLSVTGETSVNGGFTYGDAAWSTSTSNTSETLTEANMLAYNYFRLMSNTGASTYTLPASTTMTTLLPNAGDTREWIIENATSSSGITATIAAGTGIILKSVTNADDVIDETEVAELKCVRKPNTDVLCIVSELLDSD